MKENTKKTILLVEDEVIIAMGEAKVLEKHNYTVIIAHSGEEALEIFDKSPRIDLVLMDINLGDGMDGTKAAELLLEKRDVPVIFLSSHTEREVVEKTEGITSYGYIVKNSGETVLLASMNMAFRLYKANVMKQQNEHALYASEEKYRELVETSQDLIWQCDFEGRYVYLNPAWETIFGYTLDEMLGKKFTDFQTPEMAKRDMQEFARLMKGGSVKGYKTIHIGKAGNEINLVFNAKFVRDNKGEIIGTRGTAHDITELETAVQNYQTLFNEMIDGYALHEIICDKSGKPIDYRFLKINPAFENITGLKAHKLIGKTVTEALPGIESSWIDNYGEVALTGKDMAFENYSAELDRYFKVRAFCPKKGQFACIFVDITQEKKAEEALKKALLENKELLRELQHRAKNSFSMISNMLELKALASKSLEVTAALMDTSARVKAVCEMYNLLYSTESVTEIALNIYLKQVINALMGAEKNISIDITCEHIIVPAKKAVVIGLIIAELVTNACKYAFPDNEQGQITLNLNRNNDTLMIKVHDNGIGFPADFDIHDQSNTGIMLVDGLVRQLNGTFVINGNDGTQFDIELML